MNFIRYYIHTQQKYMYIYLSACVCLSFSLSPLSLSFAVVKQWNARCAKPNLKDKGKRSEWVSERVRRVHEKKNTSYFESKKKNNNFNSHREFFSWGKIFIFSKKFYLFFVISIFYSPFYYTKILTTWLG